uniref:Alpha/beta hydrolase fold domain-containing protein n=1 Tax=Neobacillus citreus TaxID=2833578 RepID=A0A942T9B3_9BACI
MTRTVVWLLSGIGVLFVLGAGVLGALRVVVGKIVLPGRDRWTPVVASDAGSVLLPATPETLRAGEYGLWHDGDGHTTVGAVLEHDQAAGTVRRAIVRSSGVLPERIRWSGHVHPGPESMAVDWTEVAIDTPVGPAPAWVVRPPTDRPGDGADASTWAVHVHGIRTTRVTALRTVPAALEVGWTSIVPSFRGDGEGPDDGPASHLGAREWPDVDAALGYALANGAARVVVVAWSMGATITHELLARSAHRDRIAGLVLVAPALDWDDTVSSQAARAGLPQVLVRAALAAMRLPVLHRVVGLRSRVDVHALSWTRATPASLPPTLMVHSPGDGTVPFTTSAAFAAAHPDTVTFAVIEGADHAWERNVDAVWFDRQITDWAESAHLG